MQPLQFFFVTVIFLQISTTFEYNWQRSGNLVSGIDMNKRFIPAKESKAVPALAYFKDKLYLIQLGKTSNQLWYSSMDIRNSKKEDAAGPTGWGPDIRIPNQESKATPALAIFNGLFMVHLGSSSNDLWYSHFDGTTWSPNKRIPDQSSKATPSLAKFRSKLHMVHVGNSSNDIWHSSFNGISWTNNKRILHQQSKTTPALATFKDKLYMVHIGNSSNDLWYSSFDGTTWTRNKQIPHQQSKATPALVSFNGKLHMIHLGNSSNDLWYSSFDGKSWTPNIRIPNHSSRSTPTLATVQFKFQTGKVHMVYLDKSSNNLWYSSFNGKTWTNAKQL